MAMNIKGYIGYGFSLSGFEYPLLSTLIYGASGSRSALAEIVRIVRRGESDLDSIEEITENICTNYISTYGDAGLGGLIVDIICEKYPFLAEHVTSIVDMNGDSWVLFLPIFPWQHKEKDASYERLMNLTEEEINNIVSDVLCLFGYTDIDFGYHEVYVEN